MVPQYAPYWRTIGLLLGVSNSSLNSIDMDYPSVKDKCLGMLLRWLKIDLSATWKAIIAVVDSLEDANGRYFYVCLHAYT